MTDSLPRQLRLLRQLALVLGCTSILGSLTIYMCIVGRVSLGAWAYLLVWGTITIVFGMVACFLAIRDLSRRYLRDDLHHYHCLNGSYDLTGNVSGVCPECGTEIPKGAGDKE